MMNEPTDKRLLGCLAQTFDEKVGAEMSGCDAATSIIQSLDADGYVIVPKHRWQEIVTAPKDGRVIDLTWMENDEPQEIWPMRWCAIQKNGMFPGQTGMWTATDGSCTWNVSHPDAGPTHWRERDDAFA